MSFIRNFRFEPLWAGLGDRCPGVDNCPSVILVRETVAQKLRMGEEALAKERMRLEELKEELSAMAEQLAEKQAELADWENGLRREEDRRATALQEAALCYRQEREQWEKSRPAMPRNQGELKEDVAAVKGAFLGINAELANTRESLVALLRAVEHQDRDGVAALCALHRDMTLTGNPFAPMLGALLQEHFHTEAIEPAPGECYDPTCHERVNAADRSGYVSCCRARGWKRMDEVLLRAVVETREGRS